jgi:acyl-coenzyme A synthetase/AMP-(fatty) acid ligase
MQEEAANVPDRVHPSEQWWRYNATSRAGFVSEFPMTITGKVQKFAMRDHMVKELGLSQVKTA